MDVGIHRIEPKIAGGMTLDSSDPVIHTLPRLFQHELLPEVNTLSIDSEGRLVDIDQSLGEEMRRLILITVPDEAETLGVIQVDNEDTRVSGLAFILEDEDDDG